MLQNRMKRDQKIELECFFQHTFSPGVPFLQVCLPNSCVSRGKNSLAISPAAGTSSARVTGKGGIGGEPSLVSLCQVRSAPLFRDSAIHRHATAYYHRRDVRTALTPRLAAPMSPSLATNRTLLYLQVITKLCSSCSCRFIESESPGLIGWPLRVMSES